MVYPRMRAWVAGVLFVGWLGFLAYLVVESYGRVIVAVPQIERSNLVVVAELTDDQGRPAAKVKIRKILHTDDEKARQLAGTTIELDELVFFSAKQGWQGAGEYVVPLSRGGEKGFEVTPLPMSPGYLPLVATVRLEVGKTPDLLAEKFSALTGAPASRLREAFRGEFATIREIPWRAKEDDRREDEKKLADAINEGGGKRIDFRLEEARIYRATPDVIEQIDKVLP